MYLLGELSSVFFFILPNRQRFIPVQYVCRICATVVSINRRISHIAFLLLLSPFTDASQAGDVVQFISEPSRCTVTVLTEDHIKSGDFTIQDVVLPLPGYDVNYPENNMKDQYRQIMANDDLDIDNMRRKVKDYALSGAYR